LAWRFSGNGEEELEFWGELVLSVQAVREVNSADAAVCMDLNSKKGSVTSFKLERKGEEG